MRVLLLHVFDGLARFALNALNKVGNFLGGLSGFLRKLADFVGDDGKTEARVRPREPLRWRRSKREDWFAQRDRR